MLGELQAWPGIPLEAHLKATARALRVLVWGEWGWRARSSGVPSWSLVLAGLAHDAGKAWEEYQKRLDDRTPSFWGHEILSSMPLLAMYDAGVRLCIDSSVLRGLAVACAAVMNHHHGMHDRFVTECFYEPRMLEKEIGRIAGKYGSSKRSIFKSIPIVLELVVGLVREEDKSVTESLKPLVESINENLILQASLQGAKLLWKDASRDKSLAAACTVATGFLSLTDTIVAGLERNKFDASKVMKRYAGRVLAEKMGEENALSKLRELAKMIKPFYTGRLIGNG